MFLGTFRRVEKENGWGKVFRFGLFSEKFVHVFTCNQQIQICGTFLLMQSRLTRVMVLYKIISFTEKFTLNRFEAAKSQIKFPQSRFPRILRLLFLRITSSLLQVEFHELLCDELFKL